MSPSVPLQVLSVIGSHPNVCCSLHLPAQSGSTAVLERMRRGYSREAYLELIDRVRRTLPRVAISSDFIAGFCGETDTEFDETLSLIEAVGYHTAYLFPYSMREVGSRCCKLGVFGVTAMLVLS
jgi:tRNA A37 methylthiotransferase MiaB